MHYQNKIVNKNFAKKINDKTKKEQNKKVEITNIETNV